MNSKDFVKEQFGMGNSPQNQASSEEVRKTFLQDFFNDAFHAINTAIQTGVVTLTPTQQAGAAKTSQVPPSIDQTIQGDELAATRASKQKAVQAKIDQLSKPQYAQQKPLTPSQQRQAKQAAAAAKVDQQTKQQYAQSKAVNKSATKDPATVLEAMDYIKESYLDEQAQSMSLSDFVIDFFNDYVAGANADYSKYEPQIKNLAKQFEAEWLKNPKGKLGMGYSKPVRQILTQLGDTALSIYKLKRGTRTVAPPSKTETGRAADTLLDLFLDQVPGQQAAEPAASVPGSPEQPIVYGTDKYTKGPKGWVDSKGKAAPAGFIPTLDAIQAGTSVPQTPQQGISNSKLKQYIKGLDVRQKQQLVNYIIKTMPAGQDLSYF